MGVQRSSCRAAIFRRACLTWVMNVILSRRRPCPLFLRSLPNRCIATSDVQGRYCCKSPFASLIRKFLGRRRVFHVRMWGSHDLALNSSVTSVIGPESLLVATFACVSFSRENHRSGFRDFCNTIPPIATEERTWHMRPKLAFSRSATQAGVQIMAKGR